jgi:type IX secretion system PorP/SprF family membrane protein
MKKLSFIFLFITWYMGLFAQQEPQFTQYMFNRVSINPASAGVSGAVCLSGIYRNQWIGYKDSVGGNTINPRTYGISFDMPVYAIKSGVGLTFQYGMLGAEKNIDVKLNYAYHRVFQKKHMLSFGLSFGLLNKSIDYSKLTPSEYDPLLENDTVLKNGTLTDIGFGIHYQIFRKFYAGISVTNLLGSSAEIGAPEFTLARHYYVFSGYDFEFTSRRKDHFVLTPGFLLRATTGAVKIDLNAILTYNDFIWGGIVYRVENAIGVIAGINYNGLRLGISYDYTMNSVFAKGSRNSLEVFLKYSHPIYPCVIKKSGYNTRNL